MAALDLPTLPDPVAAALVTAVDPFGLGGLSVRSRGGPVRDRFLALLRDLLPREAPWRRLPLGTGDSRLFGGLDLAATLAAGRPVAERGILAETDGGMLLIAMAERLPEPVAARLGAVLDTGLVVLERDGLAGRMQARVGMVALDEGYDDDERMPAALRERLAFWIDLDGFDPSQGSSEWPEPIAEARRLYPAVTLDAEILTVLAETALALGVDSLRASIMAGKAARAAAALGGRSSVSAADAALAARLVLAPRATRLPVNEAEPPKHPPSDPTPDDRAETDKEPQPGTDEQQREAKAEETLGDLVLAAARAAIPPGLLLQLQAVAAARQGRQAAGRAGVLQTTLKRGRPAGVRRGTPTGGARLNLIETLRAAAPWQRLRTNAANSTSRRIEIRRDDLRITRFKQRTETTTIFVVDASGSLALTRLAEAKGAIELLLAECYVRRDQVALLTFRGQGAELLLPPTRSLARAKRCLAELPGGGGTPLARGIDAAVGVAEGVRRRGQTPVIVFLTDGRANVARDGSTGRAGAEADARLAAQAAGAAGFRILVVDASPRPQTPARELAAVMKAIYLPLPRAEAASLSNAIRSVAA